MSTITLFISYSRTDAKFAKRLEEDLHAAGVTIWIEQDNLQPGALDWQAAIRQGIEASTAVIYIGSPDAAHSLNVGSEILVAQAKGRRIIPFWIRGDQWTESAPLN